MEDVPNPYEPRGLQREIEDDRMSDGYEPTEVPATFEVPESPEGLMDLDIFQKVQGEERIEITIIGKLILTSLCCVEFTVEVERFCLQHLHCQCPRSSW